jgi:hypothetical protein
MGAGFGCEKGCLERVWERFGARLGTKVNVYWSQFFGVICTVFVQNRGFRVLSVFSWKNGPDEWSKVGPVFVKEKFGVG